VVLGEAAYIIADGAEEGGGDVVRLGGHGDLDGR
jgi:hypothetical protein